jgi:hypothetical protein
MHHDEGISVHKIPTDRRDPRMYQILEDASRSLQFVFFELQEIVIVFYMHYQFSIQR